MTTPKQNDSNDLAIASLILGVLSLSGLGPFAGIPAIITGIMALRKNSVNKAMAVAGIVTGAVSIVFALLIMLFVVLLISFGAFNATSPELYPDSFDDNNSTEDNRYQQRA